MNDSPTLDRDEMAAEVHELIVRDLLDGPFSGNDPLAEGAVDSLGIEQLIEYVEQTYGVQLADEDIVEENFDSVPALVSLVLSKQ